MSGVVEWEVNQILVSRLLGVEHDPKRRLKEAVVMHLLHGAVAGAALAAAFSSLVYAWKPFFWLLALLFSLLLWTIAPFLPRRSLERMGGTHFSIRGILISFGSHVVYGISLGLILQIWL